MKVKFCKDSLFLTSFPLILLPEQLFLYISQLLLLGVFGPGSTEAWEITFSFKVTVSTLLSRWLSESYTKPITMVSEHLPIMHESPNSANHLSTTFIFKSINNFIDFSETTHVLKDKHTLKCFAESRPK